MKDFINHNSHCPLCGNKLTLYMVWGDQCLFRGEESPQKNTIDFYGNHFGDNDAETYQDQKVTLHYGNDAPVFSFSSSKLKHESRRFDIHFIYICNEAAIQKESFGAFEIYGVLACYYRSSGFFEMRKTNDKWRMCSKSENDYLNRHEFFSMTEKGESEKVYILDWNYEKLDTTFHYCTDKTDKVFTKTVPLMKSLDFSLDNRSNIIEKLDNWILLS